MLDEINQQIATAGGKWVNLRRKTDGILEGTIVNVDQRQKTFEGAVVLSRKTGQPRIEWVFTLQTDLSDGGGDDDGLRKFGAVESAQRAITAAVNDTPMRKLAIGGKLKIAVTEDPASDRDQAQYKARYEPPAVETARAADPFDSDDSPF